MTSNPAELRPTRSTPVHLDAVEALRGLAALYVVAFHLLVVPETHVPAPQPAAAFLNAGGTGVTLFFVISAFTLCLSSDSRMGEARPLLRFYLRRIFRIVPLFLFLLAVTIFRAWYLYRVLPHPLAVSANLTFLYNFFPGRQEGIVWASWTLGVEMVFYAFFPFLFQTVRSLRRAVLFFVISVIVAVLFGAAIDYRPDFFRFSIFRHLPAFACGFVMFFVFKKQRTPYTRNGALALVLLGCIGHWILFTYTPSDFGYLVALQSIVWSSLALGLCLCPLPILVNPVTKFAGGISYSVYLVHPLILFALSPLLGFLVSHAGPGSYPVCLFVAVTIVVLASLLTYRSIEQPGIRLGSRLIKKYCV